MNFDDFSNSISKIKNLTLPGSVSHYKMAPEFRHKAMALAKIEHKIPRRAAVMALFYPDNERNTKLLLILRNTYKGIHSNQVALPGGKVEKEDVSLKATAIRETKEEVGIVLGQLRVLRAFSKIYIPPSNFEVTPFLGLYKKEQAFIRQSHEVAAIIEVPLKDLMDDHKIVYQILNTSYANNVKVPAFKLEGYVVWGATAMILSEIKDVFKEVL